MEVRIWATGAIDHVLPWQSFIWGNCQHQSDGVTESRSVLCWFSQTIFPALRSRFGIHLSAVTLRGSHANVLIVLDEGALRGGAAEPVDQRETHEKAGSSNAHRCSGVFKTFPGALTDSFKVTALTASFVRL